MGSSSLGRGRKGTFGRKRVRRCQKGRYESRRNIPEKKKKKSLKGVLGENEALPRGTEPERRFIIISRRRGGIFEKENAIVKKSATSSGAPHERTRTNLREGKARGKKTKKNWNRTTSEENKEKMGDPGGEHLESNHSSIPREKRRPESFAI